MAHLYFSSFLFVFLLKAAPKCRGTETVSAFKGEDVALTCLNFNITDSLTCYRIRLTKYISDSSSSFIFKYPKKSQNVSRVNLKANRRGQDCVFLKTSGKSDEGMYSFEIWKGWDRINVTDISLKVKDCRPLKAEFAKPGHSVRLNCSVDAETNPTNITWAKMKGSNSVPVDLTRAKMEGTFLTIKSVFANDSGWYRCGYVIGQSQHCSEINLQVQGHQEHFSVTTTVPSSAFTENQQVSSQVFQTNKKEGSETLILVVVLVTTFIITLAALTGVFIYKRRKTNRNSAAWFGELGDVYENEHMGLPCSSAATNRINSLYAVSEGDEVKGQTFQV